MTGDEIPNDFKNHIDRQKRRLLGILAEVEEDIPAQVSASMRALVAEWARQNKEGATIAQNEALTEVSRYPSQANLSGVVRSEPTSCRWTSRRPPSPMR